MKSIRYGIETSTHSVSMLMDPGAEVLGFSSAVDLLLLDSQLNSNMQVRDHRREDG